MRVTARVARAQRKRQAEADQPDERELDAGRIARVEVIRAGKALLIATGTAVGVVVTAGGQYIAERWLR